MHKLLRFFGVAAVTTAMAYGLLTLSSTESRFANKLGADFTPTARSMIVPIPVEPLPRFELAGFNTRAGGTEIAV